MSDKEHKKGGIGKSPKNASENLTSKFDEPVVSEAVSIAEQSNIVYLDVPHCSKTCLNANTINTAGYGFNAYMSIRRMAVHEVAKGKGIDENKLVNFFVAVIIRVTALAYQTSLPKSREETLHFLGSSKARTTFLALSGVIEDSPLNNVEPEDREAWRDEVETRTYGLLKNALTALEVM
jgi:hypothetical protein